MKKFAFVFSLALAASLGFVACGSDSDSGTDANSSANSGSDKGSKNGSDYSFGFECNMFRASSCDFTTADKSWKFDIGENGFCSNVTSDEKDTLLYSMAYEITAEGATVTRVSTQIGFIGESNCANSSQGVVYEDHTSEHDIVRSCDGMHYISEESWPVDFSTPGSTLDSLYKAAKDLCEEMTSGEF